MRGFSETPRAERLEHRKRTRRFIQVTVNVEPQSKNRRNTAANDKPFHDAVMRALEEHGRRTPFRVPVAMRMHFQVSVDQAAPQIDKLPKHYLDLLQVPRNLGDARSPKLLLQDDRLVKILICTYSFADDPGSAPYVFFEISTLTDFIQELLLYSRLVSRGFDGLRDYIRLFSGYPGGEEDQHNDPVRDYRDSLRQYGAAKGRYKLFYEALLPSLQESAQHAILRRREPQPVQFAKIYECLIKRKNSSQDLIQAVAKMLRQVFDTGIATVNLGPPAIHKGDSDQFREKVQSAIRAMRENNPILDPLLTTLGITILYVPPLTAQRIDIDNLAMRVIPYVRTELKPPATYLHALQNYKEGAITQSVSDRLRRLRRVEKNQVTRYQVFEIPRLKDDPTDGRVSLLIHGRNEYSDPWQSLRNALNIWERHGPDSK